MRKLLLQFISVVMILSLLLGGCVPATPQAENKPEEVAPVEEVTKTSVEEKATATSVPVASGPIPIRIFTNQGSDQDLETNSFTKEAEKMFNLDITWELTTTDIGSANEKRQLSLASGDYPDLYLLSDYVEPFSQADLLNYGKQGIFLPLNDLIDQFAPNLKAALEKHPYFAAITYAPDGKIYGIGHWYECYHCNYAQKIWINTTWLDKLGLKTPTTTEEFRAVLEAFKTQDPNGNGIADEIPMTAAVGQGSPITMLMNAFIYDDLTTHLIMQKGKVDINANKPEWKEGLGYIQGLVKDGLLDPGAFTQNWEALQKIGNNDPQILGVGGLFPWYVAEKYQNDYWAVPPLIGPHGVQYAAYTPSAPAGAHFVLTNKASPEAQVAAIKMLDYFFTLDGFLRAGWGEEGKDWRKPGPDDVALNEKLPPVFANIPLKPDEKPHNSQWEKIAIYYWPMEWFQGWVAAKDVRSPEGFERKLQEATYLYDGKHPEEVFPHWAIWIDPEQADETAMLKQNITDYINQNALQFVTGSKDIDKEWDAYVAGFETLNLTRYLELMQQAYDRTYKK